MSMFHLKNHRVKEASFLENLGREKKEHMNVGVEGNILIPQNKENSRDVMVKLRLKLGSREDRMYLLLETATLFDVLAQGEAVTEQLVRQECLPVAMAKLRETVRQVSAAYGMTPPLELPPFGEEKTE